MNALLVEFTANVNKQIAEGGIKAADGATMIGQQQKENQLAIQTIQSKQLDEVQNYRRSILEHEPASQRERQTQSSKQDEPKTPAKILTEVAGHRPADDHGEIDASKVDPHRGGARIAAVVIGYI